MDRELERLIWKRARFRCEYCFLPQSAVRVPFHLEHIVAKQHGGLTVSHNLAIACPRCNLRKGPNLAGIDSRTKRRSWLFHPRRQKWTRHFRFDGAMIIGRTPVGRATVAVLNMNNLSTVAERKQLIDDGLYPASLTSGT